MKIEAIGIIGSNAAACSAARLFASSGLQVRVCDGFRSGLRMASAKISWALTRAGKADTFGNIEFVQSCEKLSGADLIVECQPAGEEERLLMLKKHLAAASAQTIILLSCADAPVSDIADRLDAPERFAGLGLSGFDTDLLELARTDKTSDATADTLVSFFKGLGKNPVVAHDVPGLIVERLRRPFIAGALHLMEKGKGRPHEIDAIVGDYVKAAGPFAMADIVGLDNDLRRSLMIYQRLGSPERLKPSPVEDRLVQYGYCGRRTDAGFYLYENGVIVGENPFLSDFVPYLGISAVNRDEVLAGTLGPVISEARLLAAESLLSEFDVDFSLRHAFGWAKGPFGLARELEHLLADRAANTNDTWGDAV